MSFQTITVILGIRPVKIPGNGIGRNRILEASAIGISLDHRLNEGLVDHIHFLLAVLVTEIHLLTTNNGRQLSQIYGTVQSSVMLLNGACVPQRLGVFTP